MTKSEFVAEVASKLASTKVESEKALNAVLDVLTESLAKGDSVQFIGFGTFEVKERAARDGINPRNKEKIKIPARKVISFKVGKKLKDMVAN